VTEKTALAAPNDLLANGKIVDALHRSIPKTRMVDYGMHGYDAIELDALGTSDPSWEDAAEKLAHARHAIAVDCIGKGRPQSAAQHLEWAAAALTVGQLAFNQDTARKRQMLGAANLLFGRAAGLAGNPFRRVTLTGPTDGSLFAWEFSVADSIGCVIVVGGLSGWGASYLSIARAFSARKLAVLLVEGPGQGETRMINQLFMSRTSLVHYAAAVNAAAGLGGGRVGIMGNSFGGLIAAHVAAHDERIHACCINGAVPNVRVPEFRTAREQIEAAFGASGADLDALVADFNFDPSVTPVTQPMAVVEGGNDPLVPLGAQIEFAGNQNTKPDVFSWPDGEHTIYNHAADRNALVGAWFVDQLGSERT
jgi:dienelactone hydrolase